jgi:hypothetical protein
MQRTPVSSSSVVSVGYDAANLVLEVEFESGSVYQYFDVPQNAYDDLLGASSMGKFLNTTIKQHYRYARV